MIGAYSVTFLFSLLVSMLLTRFSIWYSFKINFLDHPLTLSRKNHEKSTPLLGGTAVFLGFSLTIMFLLGVIYFFGDKIVVFFPEMLPYFKGVFQKTKNLMFILTGGLLIFLLGLKDDKDGTDPVTKLGVILVVALLLCYVNIKITLFVNHQILNFTFTLLWMAFLTNSFNLLDNMDGLSSGVAVICSILLAITAEILGQHFIVLYMLAFIGVLLGFFRFNFFGGKIYLGDSGALFIGYNLCVGTILESFYISGKTTFVSVFIPAFIFAVPFYDTLSVILIRLKNKKPIYKGDLNHFSHRLQRSGYSKKAVVTIIIGFTFFTGMCSLPVLLMKEQNLFVLFFIFLSVICGLYILEILLKKIKLKTINILN